MSKGNLIIYKAENVLNGEVYIGATTDSLHQRKLDHLERAKREENSKFHVAISIYGAWAFSWKQIDTASSINELASKERQYIVKYNSKEEGYNVDSGGGFKKMVYQYDISKGTCVQEYDCLQNAANEINATKQDISRACLSVNKAYAGFYWSYEYPFRPSKDKRLKPVGQMDLMGNVINEYASVAEASYITGIPKGSIAKACRGERKHAGGYPWKYI